MVEIDYEFDEEPVFDPTENIFEFKKLSRKEKILNSIAVAMSVGLGVDLGILVTVFFATHEIEPTLAVALLSGTYIGTFVIDAHKKALDRRQSVENLYNNLLAQNTKTQSKQQDLPISIEEEQIKA